jgi:hypothetical protein
MFVADINAGLHFKCNSKHCLFMNQIVKCPITELDAIEIDRNSYKIEIKDEYLFIRYGLRFDLILSQEKFIQNRHIIAGAILNKQLSDRDVDDVYWFSLTLDDFEEKLSQIIYPKTPKAKLDNLIKTQYQ